MPDFNRFSKQFSRDAIELNLIDIDIVLRHSVPESRMPLLPKVFFMPRDDSQGAIRLFPAVRPSIRPFVRHTLRYRLCVINFSYSCQLIFLKSCIRVVDIMKMCMWVLDGARINLTKLRPFELSSLWHFFFAL